MRAGVWRDARSRRKKRLNGTSLSDFLQLMMTLRETEASRYTERDTPIFVGTAQRAVRDPQFGRRDGCAFPNLDLRLSLRVSLIRLWLFRVHGSRP
jgi:hypothetical protein